MVLQRRMSNPVVPLRKRGINLSPDRMPRLTNRPQPQSQPPRPKTTSAHARNSLADSLSINCEGGMNTSIAVESHPWRCLAPEKGILKNSSTCRSASVGSATVPVSHGRRVHFDEDSIKISAASCNVLYGGNSVMGGTSWTVDSSLNAVNEVLRNGNGMMGATDAHVTAWDDDSQWFNEQIGLKRLTHDGDGEIQHNAKDEGNSHTKPHVNGETAAAAASSMQLLGPRTTISVSHVLNDILWKPVARDIKSPSHAPDEGIGVRVSPTQSRRRINAVRRMTRDRAQVDVAGCGGVGTSVSATPPTLRLNPKSCFSTPRLSLRARSLSEEGKLDSPVLSSQRAWDRCAAR